MIGTIQNHSTFFFQGKLLKPGEEATSYSDMEDDDEEASNNESADKKNDWIPSDECCEHREENGTVTHTPSEGSMCPSAAVGPLEW